MAERIIRKPELLKMLGVSYMTIYRLEKAGKFPKRVKLTTKAVGWRESEILHWLEMRYEFSGS